MSTIKKKYRKKKKVPLFKRKLFWIVFFVGVACIASLAYLCFHPYYYLDSIAVSGSNLISAEEVQELILNETPTFFDSINLLFISVKKIEKNILENYPRLEQANIIKKFPNALSVSVQERKKEAVWCTYSDSSADPTKCFKIDSAGIAFASTNLSSKNEFYIQDQFSRKIVAGQKVFPKDSIEFIFKAKDALRQDFNYLLDYMQIPNSSTLFVKTIDGVEIRFNFKDSLSDQLERLKILLEKEIAKDEEIEYIELRYENNIFYKPKND